MGAQVLIYSDSCFTGSLLLLPAAVYARESVDANRHVVPRRGRHLWQEWVLQILFQRDIYPGSDGHKRHAHRRYTLCGVLLQLFVWVQEQNAGTPCQLYRVDRVLLHILGISVSFSPHNAVQRLRRGHEAADGPVIHLVSDDDWEESSSADAHIFGVHHHEIRALPVLQSNPNPPYSVIPLPKNNTEKAGTVFQSV